MVTIDTTPNGREQLLSDLYFKNFLMNKFFTIQVSKQDVDGVKPSFDFFTDPYAVYDKEVIRFVESFG